MNEKKKMLILDDEVGICASLSLFFEDDFKVYSTTDVGEAIAIVKTEEIDICLLDLRIGAYNGIEVLGEMKNIDPDIVVIMMTAYFSVDSIVDAIKKGAFSYVTKPLNLEGTSLVVKQALDFHDLNRKVEYLTQELNEKNGFGEIIGKSPAMKNVFNLINKLKDVDTNVVVTGESGTGKELVARAIHSMGSRNKSRFVEINCAAVPENLLEEELFGHKKGSFTGAVEDRQGKFAYANHGTIFLDEVGDMPLALQTKLLRVLQEKEYTPIGDNVKQKVDVRVIAATNKNLKQMVDEGEFRSDLYFRLNVMEIKMPPLRDRRQDISLLIRTFMESYNGNLNKNVSRISKEAEDLLIKFDYPGNVRQLSNIIEYAMVMCSDDCIEVKDLPDEVTLFRRTESPNNQLFTQDLIGMTLKEVERKLISETLARNDGSRKKTAEVLGISVKGLRNKMHEFGLM